MGMATFTDKQDQVKRIFATKINFDKLKLQKTENCQLDTYQWECQVIINLSNGSTMIRIK
jgi:hypothetical protein